MHIPVMPGEALSLLAIRPEGIYLDATAGMGGHTSLIAQRLSTGTVIANDRDSESLEMARRNTTEWHARIRFHQGSFDMLREAVSEAGFEKLDGILADLGVSRYQLTTAERGFSFMADGPLDMRMNPRRGEPASDLLAHIGEDKLARMLAEYADEPDARIIACALTAVAVRTTTDLSRRVREAVRSERPKASDADVEKAIRRTFQALRIAVNDEFSALDAFLRALPQCLATGGRVAVLSFHSGEDRRVKKSFDAGYADGLYAAIADEVARPSAEEMRANPRAASAKLRWAVRIKN